MVGRRLLAAVGLLAVTVSGRTVEAQEAASGAPGRPVVYRIEASIMGGYRFMGDLTSAGEAPFQSVDLSNTPTWGVTLGYDLSPGVAVEAQYSYARTEATWIPWDSSQARFQFEIGVHDFQLAGLFQVPIEGPDFLVYAGLGGGVTILDTSQAVGDTTKFSFSVSLGAKRYYSGTSACVSRLAGFRRTSGRARRASTSATSTTSASTRATATCSSWSSAPERPSGSDRSRRRDVLPVESPACRADPLVCSWRAGWPSARRPRPPGPMAMTPPPSSGTPIPRKSGRTRSPWATDAWARWSSARRTRSASS